MSTMFSEPEERVALREAVKKLASQVRPRVHREAGSEGGKTTELWLEMGRTASSA
jgi:hypothetical protein